MTEEEKIQLQNLNAELSMAKKKIVKIQEEIKELEKTIYSKCQHEWKIDYTNVGEHTEYICLKCGGGRSITQGV